MRARPLLRAMPIAAFAVAGLLAPPAAAQSRKEDIARADALFREAQVLVSKGNYVEGCAKYAESQQLDPANGTLLNLALCHEKEGRYATAQREFQKLLANVSRGKTADDRERARTAMERLRSLEKKVPRVVFDVSALPKDATVTLDAEPLKDAQQVVIDPGRHLVEVTAPKKKPNKRTITVKDGPQIIALESLEDDAPPPEQPAPAPAAAAPEATPRYEATIYWTTGRVVGVVLLAAGVAAVGVGTYFGIDTFQKRDARDPHCNGKVCDAEGIALHDDATTSATVSTVAFGLGAAAILGGIYAFATASSRLITVGGRPVRLGVGPGGASITGRF